MRHEQQLSTATRCCGGAHQGRASVRGRLARVALALCILAATFLAVPAVWAAEKHRLILDWFPNADHVPLYVARDQGFWKAQGLEIELTAPADPNDPLKLVAAGRASFGINYQPNVLIARAEGLPVRSIGILVKDPLASLAFLKRSGIKTPADLKGKRIGYSVQELELALLRAITEPYGLTPGDYTTINVNFNLTSSLLSGQVDAVMGAFWNYELAELELEHVPGGYFALEQHGVPDYYELIVIANDRFVAGQRDAARRLVLGLQAAVDFARAQPEQALHIYFKANPEVRQELDRRAFSLALPHFAETQVQSAQKWAAFAKFAHERGLVAKPVEASSLYTNVVEAN